MCLKTGSDNKVYNSYGFKLTKPIVFYSDTEL